MISWKYVFKSLRTKEQLKN